MRTWKRARRRRLITVNLAQDEGTAERLSAISATAKLFDVLDVRPVLGRGFVPDDGLRGAECATVLSDGLWRDRFGSDAAVVGRDIRLNGRRSRVVGVMPAGFVFPDERERLWTARSVDPTAERLSHNRGRRMAQGKLGPFRRDNRQAPARRRSFRLGSASRA